MAANITPTPEWTAIPGWDRDTTDDGLEMNKQGQALANRVELLKQRTDKAVLSFPDYPAAFAAAATLPDGQVITSDADEVTGVVSAGVITQEQSVYKVADYAKIRGYAGRGTRLRVVDNTGAPIAFLLTRN